MSENKDRYGSRNLIQASLAPPSEGIKTKRSRSLPGLRGELAPIDLLVGWRRAGTGDRRRRRSLAEVLQDVFDGTGLYDSATMRMRP
jgi:hypothetical protein